MSTQTTKPLELVISHFVRNNYEKKYNKQHVPMAMKYLMVRFSNKLCTFLSFKEDFDLLNLLSNELPKIKGISLLYKASEHNFSTNIFHQLCDNKGATLTVIKSNHGHIFGGYTSKSWSSKFGFVSDKNAFLFLFKTEDRNIKSQCPLIFKLRKDPDFAIMNHPRYGPTFGSNDICIHTDTEGNCTQDRTSAHSFDYSTFHIDHKNYKASRNPEYYLYRPLYRTPILCGGNDGYFKVIDYEVSRLVTD